MQPYRKDLKLLARELRKNMTEPERKLWRRLRRKQVLGVVFYRQRPILDFVVDFYAPAAQLVIEIDGGQHWEEDHQERDGRRDESLEQLGLQVLRFSNLDVNQRLDGVMERIYQVVRETLG